MRLLQPYRNPSSSPGFQPNHVHVYTVVVNDDILFVVVGSILPYTSSRQLCLVPRDGDFCHQLHTECLERGHGRPDPESIFFNSMPPILDLEAVWHHV